MKQIPPWVSLPDSTRPIRSEPPVWKVEKHRELAKRLEKSLLKAPETHHIGLASESARAVKNRRLMRRTLLAVGFAVLISFLSVPYGGHHHGSNFNRGRDLFLSVPYDLIAVTPLILQTVFLAVLFAVIVNIRWWPRKKNRKPTEATVSPSSAPPNRAGKRRMTWSVILLLICFGALVVLVIPASRDAPTRRTDNQPMQQQTATQERQPEWAKAPLVDNSTGDSTQAADASGFAPDAYLAKKAQQVAEAGYANAQFDESTPGHDLEQWKEEEKLIHDPIDYQLGKWTTAAGQAFVHAKFFERNLGDRKGELDALADGLGAQKHYTLIEKQKRGGVWWVRVFLYRR